jgi:hypothetical protein
LAPAPTTGLLAAVNYDTSVTTAIKTAYGGIVDFYLDLTPKNGYNITSGAFFKVEFDSSCTDFSFVSPCSSVA